MEPHHRDLQVLHELPFPFCHGRPTETEALADLPVRTTVQLEPQQVAVPVTASPKNPVNDLMRNHQFLCIETLCRRTTHGSLTIFKEGWNPGCQHQPEDHVEIGDGHRAVECRGDPHQDLAERSFAVEHRRPNAGFASVCGHVAQAVGDRPRTVLAHPPGSDLLVFEGVTPLSALADEAKRWHGDTFVGAVEQVVDDGSTPAPGQQISGLPGQ